VTWIKFCGCTGWSDVELALAAGADAFGMIFTRSPRRITMDAARDIAARLDRGSIQPVAVVVDPHPSELAAIEAILPQALVQFSGSESPKLVAHYRARAIKAVHVDESGPANDVGELRQAIPQATLLFDTKHPVLAGGTGSAFSWSTIAPYVSDARTIVAGGLTPENVAACVRELHPFGVDVRSGIETDGRKDESKMRAFVRAVRGADAA